MNVKIKKNLHIYSTFIKKNICSKNLHNQEHYNIVITALASRGSSFEDFLAHLKNFPTNRQPINSLPTMY